MITLEGICKSYQEAERTRQVLTDLQGKIREGSFTVIQGRSGSGKSTLLNLLGGIDLPDRGTIDIDGHRISQLSENERTLFRRSHIGFVFQSFNLVPTLTVFENLAFPLELNGHSQGTSRTLVGDLLQKLSLEDRSDSYPDQLSGGEQQRIAIARAAVHKPSLILADEPTGNLDRATEAQVIDLLQSLPGEDNTTVICATHSTEIAAIADELFYLNQGRLTTS